MMNPLPGALTRRSLAAGLALALIGSGRPARAQAGASGAAEGWRTLSAAPRRMKLHPAAEAEAELWAFDGQVPGPVLRLRHGEELRLRLQNRTDRPLSLHWHGVRNLNAMDGVGGLTQPPAGPGQDFEYRFSPPDPGTFLIRPNVLGRSAEAAERGLTGLLLVEEREPPRVDREVVLMVDDWRLNPDGSLAPFGDPLEAATMGRLGNWLAPNGKNGPERLEAPPGARIRMRIANLCNARTMRIRFDDLRVYVVAVDGQPTESFEPLRATLPFPPGSRYDLLFDMPAEVGRKGTVSALVGQGSAPLLAVEAAGEVPKAPLPPIAALAPNRLLPAAIKLQDATRRDVVIGGGAQRGPGGSPVYAGDPARIWTVNGHAGDPGARPLVTVKRGTPVVLAIVNTTPVPQPLHVHGHVVRLLHPFDDGWEPYWADTLLVPEGKTVRIAFHADNPGKWVVGSTVLERYDTGLWSWFEVT